MRYRTLARSDVEVSEVSFGPMRFVTRDGSAGEGTRALHAALEGGINVVHSSAEYRTYEALGAALRSHPSRGEIRHIIKVESPDYEESAFSAASIRKQIENALRALDTEQITVVQHLQRGPGCAKGIVYGEEGDKIRIPALPDVIGPLMEVTEQLKEEGKIAELACFPHTTGFARAALVEADFDGMAHYFNLLETEMVPLFGTFAQRNMSFIGIRPVLQGMLTDHRVYRDALPEGDVKRNANWDPWYSLLDRVRGVIGEEPSDWTAYALGFALAHPVVSTVVLGLNTVAQVERALAAVEMPRPTPEVVAAAAAAREEFGWIPKETLFG